MLSFVKFAIIWVFAGMIVNHVSGWIFTKLIMRAFSEDEEACWRRVQIKNMEQGSDPDTTLIDLFWNDVFWPHTLYRAIVGYRIIVKGAKKQNG